MSVFFNFVEYAYIVGRTSSIAYNTPPGNPLDVSVVDSLIINAAPSILVVSATGFT